MVEVQRAGGRTAPAGGAAAGISAAAPKRGNQHCGRCGHKMRAGPFKRHDDEFLSAPESKRTVPANLHGSITTPRLQGPSRNFVGSASAEGMMLVREGAARRRPRAVVEGSVGQLAGWIFSDKVV